jgi:cysteine desulfurase
MFNLPWFKKRVYLDYAAATPVSSAVMKSMLPYMSTDFANPGAIHAEGQKAKQAVEEARAQVASTLGVRSEGVIFTGNGTEANNLALIGLVKSLRRTEGVPYEDIEIVTTALEHPSIKEALGQLSAMKVRVTEVAVTEEGIINPQSLASTLTKNTRLVTFAYANSEIGVVQSVSRLVREIRKAEKEFGHKIYVHVDAAQAPLWLSCKLPPLGVDMMSLDAGKCEGPKGVGMLVTHGLVPLLPLIYGGGQEGGLRPGTEAVPLIVGAATALRLAQASFEKRSSQVAKVRDEFLQILSKSDEGVILNGPVGEARLANNINISLPGLDTEYAVVYLDKYGISASTKSACAGAGGGESAVVKAISGDSERAKSTLRLTLGPKTRLADLQKTLMVLEKYRSLMNTLTK